MDYEVHLANTTTVFAVLNVFAQSDLRAGAGRWYFNNFIELTSDTTNSVKQQTTVSFPNVCVQHFKLYRLRVCLAYNYLQLFT